MSEDEGLLDLTDILRVKVYDGDGRHIGHVQDLAIEREAATPLVSSIGIHLEWTDRIGDIRLVRRAEDVVVLVPWTEVDEAGTTGYRLRCRHPELPVETAAGKLLVRRDLLDKQMKDPSGNRLHRVDDVLVERSGGSLVLAGLKVSPGLLAASPGLRAHIGKLKSRFKSRYNAEFVPWEAIERIDDESIVIGASTALPATGRPE